MLRDIKASDLAELDRIHEHCQTFGVPKLTNLIDDKVVTSPDGSIVGYGMLKMFPEAIMILDTSKSVRQRMEALNEFILHAIEVAKGNSVEQIHAFVEDEKFAHLLIERYGFNTVRSKPLVLNLE